MNELVGVSFAVQCSFGRGAFVVEADQPAETIFLIRRGQVREFWLDDDGRETTTAILGPGQLVGHAPLLGFASHRVFGQALTPRVEAWALETDMVLDRLAHDRALLGLVSGALAQRFALAAGLLRDVSLLPVLERLCDVEQRLAACLLGETPALTRAGLAHLIHARPETLARRRHQPAVGDEPLTLPPLRLGTHSFAAGSVALEGDLAVGQVGQVLSGQLRLSLVGSGGRALHFDVLSRGDLLGVPALVGMRGLGLRAEALSRCSLRVMDAATFLNEIAAEPTALHELGRGLGARLAQLEQRLAQDERSMDQRVLACIAALGTPGTSGRWSHAWLAQQIGVARETVTRTLAHLEAGGRLHREGRRIVLH